MNIGESQNPDAKQPKPPPQTPWLSYSIGELILATALLALLAALGTYLPGLAIFAAAIIAAVSVRTLLVLRRRAQLGQITTRGQRITLFLASLAVATLMVGSILALLAFAGFTAVMLTCGEAGMVQWSLLGAAVALGLVFATFVFVRWIRKRWRRDTQPPPGDDAI